MAKEHIRDTSNPIKATGATKATTRYKADRAEPRGGPIYDRNSRVDRMLRPGDTAHPSQRGGATATRPGPNLDTSTRKGRVVGSKRTERGLVKGSSSDHTRSGRSRDGDRSRSAVRSSRGARARGRRKGGR
jgi:hypothetical protein